ncbi:MAG: hypothetical protein HA496_09610 [Thaumarchaeota archaeon]|nr:hypothetical protein [Nitrososphaerota archaeon]
MSIVKTILKLVAVIVSGSLVKKLLDSIGYSLGLDLGGLTSLITVAAMVFLTIYLFSPGKYFKNGLRRVFEKVFSFLLIWLTAAFSSALFHTKYYTQIGFVVALLYIVLTIRKPVNIGIRLNRLRIVSKEEPAQPEDHMILLSLAPVPRVAFLHGFGPSGLLKLLTGGARLSLKLPEDVFIESFKHRQTLRLKGNLSTLVEAVGKGVTGSIAILCEAKPAREFMKIEVASDNPQALEGFTEKLKETGPGSQHGVRRALEEWLSLKPYVTPVPELLYPNPILLAGRLLIVGERRNAEDLALQLCLSQLRRNSVSLVVEGRAGNVEDDVRMRLVEKGFKPSGNRLLKKPFETYRCRDGMEVVFADKPSGGAFLKKKPSKPLVAVWFRDLVQNLDVNAPIRILTLGKPWACSSFEADSIILIGCEKELVESFLPSRGLALEGKTVLVSRQGVRVLK